MEGTENTSKTDAHVAHFYRALGRAHDERMPMPRDVHRQSGDSMCLYFYDNDTDSVRAWAALLGVEVGARYTLDGGRYHSYGTAPHVFGQWQGWPVELCVFVDGPAPEVES